MSLSRALAAVVAAVLIAPAAASALPDDLAFRSSVGQAARCTPTTPANTFDSPFGLAVSPSSRDVYATAEFSKRSST